MRSQTPIDSRTRAAIVLLLMVPVMLAGCIAGDYGRLQSNSEVLRKFQNYQVLPNHNYFYRGTFNTPIAIVGIDKKYQLDLALWVPVDPQSDSFRTIIQRIGLVVSGGSVEPWGFDILDQNGNVIGVWYSASRAATVKVNANNQIEMLSPMPTAARGQQPAGRD